MFENNENQNSQSPNDLSSLNGLKTEPTPVEQSTPNPNNQPFNESLLSTNPNNIPGLSSNLSSQSVFPEEPTTIPSSLSNTPPVNSQPPSSTPPQNTFHSGFNSQSTNIFQETPKTNSNIISNTSLENINKIKMVKNRRHSKSNIFQIIAITLAIFLVSCIMISAISFHARLLHISGTSMEPTIETSSWVLSTSKKEYNHGDIIAFNHKDVIMIKRIIGVPGDIVNIDLSGTVTINGNVIEEPYLTSKSLGQPEIKFPYTVQPNTYFVLGDNRADSIDSRNLAIGGVKTTDIVGKVTYSIIPYKKLS